MDMLATNSPTCTINFERQFPTSSSLVGKVRQLLQDKLLSMEMADAHYLAIDIANLAERHFEVPVMAFAGKRARTTSIERSKPLKVAAAKLEAEEFTKREVTEPAAIAVMNRAKALLNEGPDTPMSLCSNFGNADITNIQSFIDEEDERNGPTFYMKLLPHFVPEYRQYKQLCEQFLTAKLALEKSWNFRMITMFMNADCSMTRDNILSALDERRANIKRAEEEHQRNLQVNQQVMNAAQAQLQDVLQNPERLMQLMADPRVQAIMAGNRANPEGMANPAANNPNLMD
jgi:hypothetical protein